MMDSSSTRAAARVAKQRGGLYRGDRVAHDRFGDGDVTGFALDNTGTMCASVAFDHQKKAMRIPVSQLRAISRSAKIIMFPQKHIRRRVEYRSVRVIPNVADQFKTTSNSTLDAAA